MANLPKFTLTHNEKKDRWDLTKDSANRPTANFDKKAKPPKAASSKRPSAKVAVR